MVGMDKTQPIRLKHFHENDGGRAKNGTQCKQCGKECNWLELVRYQKSGRVNFSASKINVKKIGSTITSIVSSI